MTDREQHYHAKKIPEEIIKLAGTYQSSKEKCEIYTEVTGEPFIIEYSKNPFSAGFFHPPAVILLAADDTV